MIKSMWDAWTTTICHGWFIVISAFAGAFVGVLVMGMVNLTRESSINAAIDRIIKKCKKEHGEGPE